MKPDKLEERIRIILHNTNHKLNRDDSTVNQLLDLVQQERHKAYFKGIEFEREHLFGLAKGLKLEPDNLKKQIEDFEKLLEELKK